jgi:two-component system response regulator RegA
MRPSNRRTRALIVDDAVCIGRVVARILKKRDIECHTVLTVEDALSVIEEPWDIAVVDIVLTDGSGIDVCEALVQKAPRPIVIAISGVTSASIGFNLAHLGVSAFLEKPFDADELWAVVEKHDRARPLELPARAAVGLLPLPLAAQRVREAMVAEALQRGSTLSGAARILSVSRQAMQQAVPERTVEEARKAPKTRMRRRRLKQSAKLKASARRKKSHSGKKPIAPGVRLSRWTRGAAGIARIGGRMRLAILERVEP